MSTPQTSWSGAAKTGTTSDNRLYGRLLDGGMTAPTASRMVDLWLVYRFIRQTPVLGFDEFAGITATSPLRDLHRSPNTCSSTAAVIHAASSSALQASSRVYCTNRWGPVRTRSTSRALAAVRPGRSGCFPARMLTARRTRSGAAARCVRSPRGRPHRRAPTRLSPRAWRCWLAFGDSALGPSRGGREQAQGAGAVHCLVAAVDAELGI